MPGFWQQNAQFQERVFCARVRFILKACTYTDIFKKKTDRKRPYLYGEKRFLTDKRTSPLYIPEMSYSSLFSSEWVDGESESASLLQFQTYSEMNKLFWGGGETLDKGV